MGNILQERASSEMDLSLESIFRDSGVCGIIVILLLLVQLLLEVTFRVQAFRCKLGKEAYANKHFSIVIIILFCYWITLLVLDIVLSDANLYIVGYFALCTALATLCVIALFLYFGYQMYKRLRRYPNSPYNIKRSLKRVSSLGFLFDL